MDGRAKVTRPELIGRGREAGQLAEAVRLARRRHGGLVLVAGEAGIGKTRLTESVVGRSSMVVLRGATRMGGTPPFGPVVAAVRSHPAWPGISDQVLDVASREKLRALFPELIPQGRRRSPSPPDAHGSDGGAGVARAVDPTEAADEVGLMARLIVDLARSSPTTMVLDDLQWVDHATAELLQVLAASAVRERLLVIGVYRTDEFPRSSPLRRLRTELRRGGRLAELLLEPLDAADVLDLAARILGARPALRRGGRLAELLLEPLDAADVLDLAARILGARPAGSLARRLFERSQGVPLYVEELAAALEVEGAMLIEDGVATLTRDDLPIPDTLRDSVLVRADGVAAGSREALAVAALLGDRASIAIVDDLVPGAGDWIRAGVEAGILVAEPSDHVSFRHSLVRDVLAEELPSPDRRARHRRIATLLAERGSDELEVAEHWLAADDAAEGVRWLIRAGEASCRVHAFRDAAAAFRRALDEDRGTLADRVVVLEQLAECSELSGSIGEAARTWETAAAARSAARDEAAAAQDRRRHARALEVQGRWRRAIEARLSAARGFAATGAAAEAAIERLAAAVHLRSAASFTAALEVIGEAKRDATAAGRPDLEARAMGLEGNVLARMGDAERGLELVRRALARSLDVGAAGVAAELYQRLADSLEHSGRYQSARGVYLEGAAYCRTQALEPTAQLCLACMAVVLWQTGDWPGAERVCRDVIASSEATTHARAVADGILGSVWASRGRPGSARPHLEASLALARRIELAAMELSATWGLAIVDRLEGDVDSAVERCRDLLARWDRTEERHYVVPILRWVAAFHADRGDGAAVRACAEALAGIAAQTGQPEAVAALGLALGEAARLEGDAVRAAEHLERALEVLAERDLPLERAEIGRRAGLALVESGRRADGLGRLVEAARLARRLGAAPLAGAIADDLARLGESVERRLGRREATRLADGGLTRRELEVIRLVARGLTSREIGDTLFISARTVEMHVGSALVKLDCRTRAEAAQRVASLGLLA